jgi:hypothetical protein
MAFAGSRNADASKGTFNDVGQNQFNIGNIQLAAASQSPSLEAAFSIANYISSMVQQVQTSREQIAVLVASITTLLMTLDAEYQAKPLLEAQSALALQNLNEYVIPQFYQKDPSCRLEMGNRLLKEVAEFVQKQTVTGFMKSLSAKDERVAQIETYYRRIETSIASFQVCLVLQMR